MSKFEMSGKNIMDGCYIQFERVEQLDDDCDPKDYLFQDEAYLEADKERMDAFAREEWNFIGVIARAHICVVVNQVGVNTQMDSPGLWGIESDSDEEYLEEVFQSEIRELKQIIIAMSDPIYHSSLGF